jgi:integrase
MRKSTRVIEREKVKEGIWRRRDARGAWVYEIAYRDSDGVQRRQTIHGGMRAAETALAKVKADKGQGKRVVPSPKLTFSEAADNWLASVRRVRRGTTVDTYEASLRTHLLPAWGKLRLDHIDVDKVATLIERMGTAEYRSTINRNLGKGAVESGYSPLTVRRTLVAAARVFDFARRRMNWAGGNPVRDLDNSERPAHEGRERRILSHDELRAVLDAADAAYRPVLAFAAFTGARLGECLGLQWQDVNLDAGTVYIRQQADRQGALVALKTKRSRRVIELPSNLVAMLKAHKLASSFSRDDNLVFVSRTGSPMEHRNVAQRGLARACKRAGIAQPWPTMHELRHAHASALIAGGIDLVELSARLGHENPAITASVYSHEFEVARRSDERRARLDAIYGPATVEAPATGLKLAK